MKNFLKVFTLVMLVLLSAVALISCGMGGGNNGGGNDNPVKVLETYLLEQDGKTVSNSFALDGSITIANKVYTLEWTSSAPCVTITKDENGGFVAPTIYFLGIFAVVSQIFMEYFQ